MGIFLGLLSAVSWGSADFLARGATRRAGTYRTIFYGQFFGFIVVGAYLAFSGELAARIGPPDSSDWLIVLAFAFLYLMGNLALYRAFEVCTALAVVSPIGATYASVTVVLSILSGEHLTTARLAGIALALVGVALSATNLQSRPPTAFMPRAGLLGDGVGWALFAAVTYGVAFWLLGFRVAPVFGGFLPTWIVRAVALVTLALAALARPRRIQPPPARLLLLIVAISMLDTTALVSNVIGLTTEQVSVVTVLGSLFTAVTVLLSWIFLRERLVPNQWIGILLVLASLVLVTA